MRDRLKRWLAAPRARWLIVAVAVALAAPSLDTGFSADDHFHRLLLRRPPPLDGLPTRPLDLFTFAAGDPVATHKLVDVGMFPWWADPSVRLSFWRPLSALTHVADHALAPESAPLAHAHNLLWFALALTAVGAFYRRFAGESWLAGLAFLLYAVDDAHGPAVGWVANRNAMVALALSLPAVIFHDRWRRDGWKPGAWLAPLSLALGLFAGEAALATSAYLAAHALHVDRGPLRQRLARLAPYVAVVVVWRAVYVELGYGTFGSGVYLDPAQDPRAFLAALPVRYVMLLAGQLALPWSDFASFYTFLGPRAVATMTALAVVTLGAVAALLAPVWRRDPMARFFATGMLLATIPICSTFPADRLLWFVGLGGMGLIAKLLASAPRRLFARAGVAGLAGIHLLLAPPLLALRSRSMVTVEGPLARANDSLPKTPDLAGQTMVLINPPADIFAGYLAMTREDTGVPRPRFRWLATGVDGVEVRRLDARTLEVKPARGFLHGLTETMLRSPRRPIALGSRVALTGLDIEVTAVADGRPAVAVFRFDVPLEDPSLRWAEWREFGYRPFVPPAVGQTTVLPPVDFFAAIFGKK